MHVLRELVRRTLASAALMAKMRGCQSRGTFMAPRRIVPVFSHVLACAAMGFKQPVTASAPKAKEGKGLRRAGALLGPAESNFW